MRPRATVLVTASIVLLLGQVVRAWFPVGNTLVREMGGIRGYVVGGAAVLGVFAAVAAVALGAGLMRRRPALVAACGGVVAGRLAIQLVRPIPLAVAVVALGVGLVGAAVAIAIVWRVDGGALLTGTVVGLAIEAAIRGATSSWDLVWQAGAGPIVVVFLAGVATIAAAWFVPRDPRRTREPPALRLALFGPFLALQLLILQNAPAVASQTGLSLGAATALVILGDAAALGVASLRGPVAAPIALAFTVLGTVGAFVLAEATGGWAAVLVIAEQCVVVILLRRSLVDHPTRAGGRPSSAIASFTLGSIGFATLVLLAQPPARYRFDVPVAAVLAVAAATVGVGSAVARGGSRSRAEPIVPVAVALLALPYVLASASGPAGTTGASVEGAVRVVTYNIHGTTNGEGQVDPEASARAIERLDPDVVVLQEVARGWPIFGSLDTAEWLSRRLDMRYVFQPAADAQLGNAILSRLPIVEAGGGPLPSDEGEQARSYVTARIRIAAGELLVVGVHLDAGVDGEAGVRQIEELLAVVSGTSPAVVAGDMNMQPSDADVARFLDAGLVSVQDELGFPCRPTVGEPEPSEPCDRPDWIFATPDLEADDFVISRTPASDHLPVAVTLMG